MLFDHPIALAGAFFKSCSVEDSDLSSGVRDEGLFLERKGGYADIRPRRAPQMREKLLRHLELETTCAVRAEQQPT